MSWAESDWAARRLARSWTQVSKWSIQASMVKYQRPSLEGSSGEPAGKVADQRSLLISAKGTAVHLRCEL